MFGASTAESKTIQFDSTPENSLRCITKYNTVAIRVWHCNMVTYQNV
uniref:Uncharacterized protein n=1 Tax=Anguilla anguilla TaxID=7936 RepID=A0A0E9VBF1_ANGAN